MPRIIFYGRTIYSMLFIAFVLTFVTPIIDNVNDDAICTIANSATSMANAKAPPTPTSESECKRLGIDSKRKPFLDAAKSTPKNFQFLINLSTF